jgi:hypothetical protein
MQADVNWHGMLRHGARGVQGLPPATLDFSA